MTKQAAELLTQYGGELYEKYSGRGMYGKETMGVVFDTEREFFTSVANAVSDIIEDENREDGEALCTALRSLKTDNIGTGIIYY